MRSKIQGIRFPVGLRTLKTAVAVAASILLVERYGTSADELLFGVMGVFSAEASLTSVFGMGTGGPSS